MKTFFISMILIWNQANSTTVLSDGIEASDELNKESKPEYTIMVGRLQRQEYVDDVMPTRCIEAVCMSSFYHYHIKVDDVIVGESLSRKIKVARFQHAKYLFRSSQTALFVIERVTNPSWEQHLDTPYNLVEFSQLKAEHCLIYPFKKYSSYFGDDESCIQTKLINAKGNLIADELRYEMFNEVVERVQYRLDKDDILRSVEDHQLSDGTHVVDTEDQEERCYDVDFDKNFKKRDCDFSEYYDLLRYQLTKGQGEAAMELFKQELNASRLNLKPFDIRYRVIEHDEYSEFQVHYNY
ncbi:hypothetical protein ACFODZ_11280 [Marinicella sediminis]|uniref:Uncharacterized protein n=1 Tax=Marinicella sediminis TaxID=1792834 RepID=A0ABV7J9M4_9GAMM|nr:hypothetical protein [Marinicella sediminis]